MQENGKKLRTGVGPVRICEWKMVLENGDGMNWNGRQLMNDVYKRVREIGLS